MRYCAIAYTFYDNDHRVKRYCETLAGQGHEVEAIVLKGGLPDEPDFVNGVRVYRIQERIFESENIAKYLWNYIRFFLRGMALLTRQHLRRKYNLLHFHNIPDFLVFMGLIPKLTGARVILDIHDIVPEYYSQKFGKSMKALPIRLLLIAERLSVAFADHVITANDLWRKKIADRDRVHDPDITSLLNYPSEKYYPRSRIREPRKRDGFRLVYPGTISRHHGVDILIEAVGLAGRKIPGLTLDIYSLMNNEMLEEFKAMCSDNGTGDLVHFNNIVSNEKLGEILGDYDAGVVPKRGGLFADEAFSSKIFDYMAAGLPIIASRTKVDEYYFNDEMLAFFEPGDPVDMADRIVQLAENLERRRSMVEKCQEYIRENTWEQKQQLFLDLVDNLI